MKQLLLTLFLLSTAHSGYAAITSGVELLELCESKDQKAQGICLGTIWGISETTQIYQGLGYIPKVFCPPSMSKFELAEVIVSHLENNQQNIEKQAGIIFLTVMKQKYPCAGK